jgi:hypothetical protein
VELVDSVVVKRGGNPFKNSGRKLPKTGGGSANRQILLAINATHTTSHMLNFFLNLILIIVIGFRMNLILAYALDGNQQILLLA